MLHASTARKSSWRSGSRPSLHFDIVLSDFQEATFPLRTVALAGPLTVAPALMVAGGCNQALVSQHGLLLG